MEQNLVQRIRMLDLGMTDEELYGSIWNTLQNNGIEFEALREFSDEKLIAALKKNRD